MICDKIVLPNGDVGIVCRSGRRRRTCFVCAGKESRLCDFPVANGRTCSRSLCARHAIRAKRPGVKSEIDFCPEHWERRSEFIRVLVWLEESSGQRWLPPKIATGPDADMVAIAQKVNRMLEKLGFVKIDAAIHGGERRIVITARGKISLLNAKEVVRLDE